MILQTLGFTYNTIKIKNTKNFFLSQSKQKTSFYVLEWSCRATWFDDWRVKKLILYFRSKQNQTNRLIFKESAVKSAR